MNKENNIELYVSSFDNVSRQKHLFEFDIKKNNGDHKTSPELINEQKWLDYTQNILDFAGFVPAYGDAIDIVNAIISFARAGVKGTFMPHGLNGILSCIAVIPVAGSIIAVPLKALFKAFPISTANRIIKSLSKEGGEKAAKTLFKEADNVPAAKKILMELTAMVSKHLSKILVGTKALKRLFKTLAFVPFTKVDDVFAKYGISLIEKLEKFFIALSKKGAGKASSKVLKIGMQFVEIPAKYLTKGGRLASKGFGQLTLGGRRAFLASQDMFGIYLKKEGKQHLSGVVGDRYLKSAIKSLSARGISNATEKQISKEITNLMILNNPRLFNEFISSSSAKQRFATFVKGVDPKIAKDVNSVWGKIRKTGIRVSTNGVIGLPFISKEKTSDEEYRKEREQDMYRKEQNILDKDKKGDHYGKLRNA
jgi:hypothetical protein